MTKTCSKCKQVKGVEAFHRDASTSDGLRCMCKDCVKVYYQEHAKEYRQRETRNRTELNRKARVRYHERYREKKSAYAKANRDRINKWNAATGKGQQYNNDRRASIVQAFGNFTATEFKCLCSDFHNQCLDCGSYDKPLTADHVIPLSKGGNNTIDNIQPLCGPCNSRKGVRSIDYRNSVQV